MAKIYEIIDKYKFIQNLIEDGIEQETFSEALNSIDDELSNKLEAYAMVIKNIESDINGFKEQEKRLADRRKTMENNIKFMKQNMEFALKESGKKEISSSLFKFKIQKNPPTLFIKDENLIPRNYFKVIPPQIDKKELLKSIKEGNNYEGVEIIQSESLRIK